MNRSELIEIVARKTKIDANSVEGVVDETLKVITLSLMTDEPVTFRGFGKFATSQRPAVNLKNPQNGEPIHVEACRTARFKPAPGLKEKLNSDPLT